MPSDMPSDSPRDVEGLAWEPGADSSNLTRPVLVVALGGWFDAAGTATQAVDWLLQRRPAVPVARLDSECFVDLRSHRPMVRLDEVGDRVIEWPDVTANAIRTGGTHDLVIVRGNEPDYRWRTFVDGIVAIATMTRAELVVTLGATPAEAPHTRPQLLTTSASSPRIARQLGLALPTYQGITGVIGVLQERLGRIDLPGISVRVGIPPYLGKGPNPGGAQALLARLGELLDIDTHSRALDNDVKDWITGLQAVMEDDPQARATVEHFERRFEQLSEASVDPDRLVRDLERYLREGGDGGAAGGPDGKPGNP